MSNVVPHVNAAAAAVDVVVDVPAYVHADAQHFPAASSTYGISRTFDDDAYYDRMDDDGDDGDDHPCIEHNTSMAESVMTAEGLADKEGFWIVLSVVLISDMTRGVTFPIMWPLVEDMGGNHIWLGYVVASFSLGRVFASPVLGKWSVSRGYTITLVSSTTVLLLGCVLFAHAYEVGSVYYLIFTQIVLGVGSATLGVTRSYVAEITATRQRTTYLALLTAVQYGAFTGMLFCVLIVPSPPSFLRNRVPYTEDISSLDLLLLHVKCELLQ
jgi:hypothetical protein